MLENGEMPKQDTQQHILECSEINKDFQCTDVIKENIHYSDILGSDTKKQKEIIVLYERLLTRKQDLLSKREPALLDPCTCIR